MKKKNIIKNLMILMLVIISIICLKVYAETSSYITDYKVDWQSAADNSINFSTESNLTVQKVAISKSSSGGYVVIGYLETSSSVDNAGIIKYNEDGTIAWSHSVGGTSPTGFSFIVAVSDGYVVVGSSASTDAVGDDADAIIVKYNEDGTIAWSHNAGGSDSDYYESIMAVSDGYVVVGSSASADASEWGNNGGADAIIVKYDLDGDIVWSHNAGGTDYDYYDSIMAVSDGYVVVGSSAIVKYDLDGDIVWSHNAGGTDDAWYHLIIAVSDGYVVVGETYSTDADAIIVKYNEDGTIAWSHNAGGSDFDYYDSIVAVSDGYVVVGSSASADASEWGNNGGDDAIIVKYDLDGDIVWSHNAGGTDDDWYESIMAVSDGYVVLGLSQDLSLTGTFYSASFGNLLKYDKNGNIVWTYTRESFEYFYTGLYVTSKGFVSTMFKFSDMSSSFSKVSSLKEEIITDEIITDEIITDEIIPPVTNVSNSNSVSPKTGDINVSVITLIGAVTLIGLFITIKKIKRNN